MPRRPRRGVNTLEVSTVVAVPPAEVYEFLVDFPRYARYSEYLDAVDQDGDGSSGTEYDLHFSWWRVSYTARSAVDALDPPERIEWSVVNDVDASGHWEVEPAPDAASDGGATVDESSVGDSTVDDSPEASSAEGEGDADAASASRVGLFVEYDPDSVGSGVVDLPRFVSFDAILDRVKPLVVEEAERVVERIVTDLEGEPRPVDLDIDTGRSGR